MSCYWKLDTFDTFDETLINNISLSFKTSFEKAIAGFLCRPVLMAQRIKLPATKLLLTAFCYLAFIVFVATAQIAVRHKIGTCALALYFLSINVPGVPTIIPVDTCGNRKYMSAPNIRANLDTVEFVLDLYLDILLPSTNSGAFYQKKVSRAGASRWIHPTHTARCNYLSCPWNMLCLWQNTPRHCTWYFINNMGWGSIRAKFKRKRKTIDISDKTHTTTSISRQTP